MMEISVLQEGSKGPRPIVIAPLSEEEEKLLYSEEDEGGSGNTAINNQEYIDPTLMNYVDDTNTLNAKREGSHASEQNRVRPQTINSSDTGPGAFDVISNVAIGQRQVSSLCARTYDTPDNSPGTNAKFPSYYQSRRLNAIAQSAVSQSDSPQVQGTNGANGGNVFNQSTTTSQNSTLPGSVTSRSNSRFRPIQPNLMKLLQEASVSKSAGGSPVTLQTLNSYRNIAKKPTLTLNKSSPQISHTSLQGLGMLNGTNDGGSSNQMAIDSQNTTLGQILSNRSNAQLQATQPKQNILDNVSKNGTATNIKSTQNTVISKAALNLKKNAAPLGNSLAHSGLMKSKSLLKNARYASANWKIVNGQLYPRYQQPSVSKVMTTSVVNFGKDTKLVSYPKAVRLASDSAPKIMATNTLTRQFGKAAKQVEVPEVVEDGSTEIVKAEDDGTKQMKNESRDGKGNIDDTKVVKNENKDVQGNTDHEDNTKVVKNENTDVQGNTDDTRVVTNENTDIQGNTDDTKVVNSDVLDNPKAEQPPQEDASEGSAGTVKSSPSNVAAVTKLAGLSEPLEPTSKSDKTLFCLKCNQTFNNSYEMRLHGIVNISKNAQVGTEQKWVLSNGRSVKVCYSLLPKPCDIDQSDSARKRPWKEVWRDCSGVNRKNPQVNKKKKEVPVQFQCEKCLDIFTHKLKFQKHEWQHRWNKNFKCPVEGCSIQYLAAWRLKAHERACRFKKTTNELERKFGGSFSEGKVFMCKVPGCKAPPFKDRCDVETHISLKHKYYVDGLVDECKKLPSDQTEQSHGASVEISFIKAENLVDKEQNENVNPTNENNAKESNKFITNEGNSNKETNKKDLEGNDLPLEQASKKLGERLKHFTQMKLGDIPSNNKQPPKGPNKNLPIEEMTWNRKNMTWSSIPRKPRKFVPSYTHHNVTRHHCLRCQVGFSGFQQLRRHLKDQVCSKIKRCNVCEFSSETWGELNRHLSTAHKLEDKTICPTCGRAFQDIHWLKMHLCAKKPQKSKDFGWYTSSKVNGVSSFSCPYCDYVANRHERIQRHVRERHEHFYMASCPHCNFKTYNQSKLEEHCEEQHGIPFLGNH